VRRDCEHLTPGGGAGGERVERRLGFLERQDCPDDRSHRTSRDSSERSNEISQSRRPATQNAEFTQGDVRGRQLESHTLRVTDLDEPPSCGKQRQRERNGVGRPGAVEHELRRASRKHTRRFRGGVRELRVVRAGGHRKLELLAGDVDREHLGPDVTGHLAGREAETAGADDGDALAPRETADGDERAPDRRTASGTTQASTDEMPSGTATRLRTGTTT
jgi:hypothetical protein